MSDLSFCAAYVHTLLIYAAIKDHVGTVLLLMTLLSQGCSKAALLWWQAKQSDAQELTSGQASTMARNEQVIDTLTGQML